MILRNVVGVSEGELEKEQHNEVHRLVHCQKKRGQRRENEGRTG